MRPLEEARAEVLAALTLLPAHQVGLDEAMGLVLAEEVTAQHPVPPFDNSAVDGFAVRSSDLVSPRSGLTVLEDVPAGSVATKAVTEGTAIKIMTGAPIPAGADAVIRVEDTAQDGNRVDVHVAVPKSTAIRPAGGDLQPGATVFAPGTRLGPAHLGVLASVGVTAPLVHRRARVAIFSTGDELRSPEVADLAPGSIRDSNRPLLRGLLTEAGVDIIDRGIIRDDRRALTEAFEASAAEADAIVTSGGVSMGDYDLVKQVLGDLGGVELWKVAMQPAKPFAFGHIGSTPLFGLPGNPVSVFVAFEQFVRPGLLGMMGNTAIFRRRVEGIAGERIDTDPEKTVFVRARIREESGRRVFVMSGGQSSNVLSAMAEADCFAVVERGRGVVDPGEMVPLEMFKWPAEETER